MKPDFLFVKDNPGLIRDSKTGSILNVDDDSYKKYKNDRYYEQKKLDKENAQEKRINMLENKMGDIENKLNRILELIINDKS